MSPSEGDPQRPLIVVVEDDPTNQEYMTAVLEEAYRIRVAGDGAAMWQELARDGDQVAAILMDIGLPGDDGLVLTRKLRAEARWRELPIVAVTAFQETRDVALLSGATAFLGKPVSRQSLLPLLDRLLAARRPARQ